ncbi:MAG: hypothetical protein EPO36_08150 [Chloroflexota bacterium]|nr:MAG: hypothetical protein EPO36_08150 [Chloroflexota bacterium]
MQVLGVGRAWFLGSAMLIAACAPAPVATTSPPVPATATPTPTSTPAPRPTVTPPPALDQPGAVGSPGCDRPPPEPGDSTIELAIDGEDRTALLHVPPGVQPGVPLPLVLVFHEAYMDGQQMVDLTGFSGRADADGFLVAYPNAVGDRQAWNTPEATDQASDAAFARAIVDGLEAEACLDQRRVYAVGLSMGGAMAQLAACRDERIVAVSLVAAVHGDAGTRCVPDRPVAAVSIHGLLDPLVPWRGGLNPLPEFADHPAYQDVLEWAAAWAVHNGCDPQPQEQDVVGDWVVPFEWDNCRAPVVVYRVGDGGHTWPGASGASVFGGTNQDVDATELSTAFFLENPAPPPAIVFEDAALGYRVRVPVGWPEPWVGRFGYHQVVAGSVTFPVGVPVMLDVWATQIVLTSGPIGDGPLTPGGPLPGETADGLARRLMQDVAGYEVSPVTVSVGGEPAVVLEGPVGEPLPMAVVFTHGDRAFLLYVYHEVPIAMDDRETLDRFLAGFEFTE